MYFKCDTKQCQNVRYYNQAKTLMGKTSTIAGFITGDS